MAIRELTLEAVNRALGDMERRYASLTHAYHNGGFAPKGLRVPATVPHNPAPGDMYWDAENDRARVFKPTGWANLVAERPECYFPIWAEENSTLGGSNTYEWAFGNGANTQNNEGVMLYVPSGWTCTVVAMGAQIGTASSSATIELVVNGTPQGSSAHIVLTNAANGLSELSTPLAVSSGDRINFRTTSSSSTQAACTVIAWFRMVKT